MTRAQVRAAIVARLVAGVAGLGGRVHSSRAWPLQASGIGGAARMPAALVYADRLRRTSVSGGMSAPTYRTILTITIVLRAEGKTEAAVESSLDTLGTAVESAIFTHPGTMAIAEDIVASDCARDLRPDGDLIVGQEAISLDLQFTEMFEPAGLPDLATARIVIDAIDPADLVGTYPVIDPFPAAAAAPRERGPDGRPEADDLTIILNP